MTRFSQRRTKIIKPLYHRPEKTIAFHSCIETAFTWARALCETMHASSKSTNYDWLEVFFRIKKTMPNTYGECYGAR